MNPPSNRIPPHMRKQGCCPWCNGEYALIKYKPTYVIMRCEGCHHHQSLPTGDRHLKPITDFPKLPDHLIPEEDARRD